MASGTHHDVPGRIIGMLVFLIGAALLGLVFYIAYSLFNASPSSVLGLTFTGNPRTDPTVALIGSHFGVLLFRLAYLFVMAIAGSLISQKGINLYFSSIRGHAVDLAPRLHAAPQVDASPQS